ncbi:MAG: hypothetical protein ACT4QB_00820 [Gammaproteobacteria bacterium]
MRFPTIPEDCPNASRSYPCLEKQRADGSRGMERAAGGYLEKRCAQRGMLEHFERLEREAHALCRDGRKSLRIGSGVVEATCKTLATQRTKRSGIRWRHAGGQAILSLRALIQSQRFDQAWEMLSQTYRAEITPPDNVVALPRRRIHDQVEAYTLK